MPKTRSQTTYTTDSDTRSKMKQKTQDNPLKAGTTIITTSPRGSQREVLDVQLGGAATRPPEPQSTNVSTVNDLYFWLVERVVQELYYKLPLRTPPSTPIPNLVNLEKAFWLHNVTGSVLLHDISHPTLKERYKLETLGERAYVRRAIEDLWLSSPQFLSETDLP
jgi:hypothetical protein